MSKPKTEEQLLNDRLQLLHDLAQLFYAQNGNSCGGALHILLDDLNVRDGDIDFCREELNEPEHAHVKELGTAILDMLATLSPAQRLYWTEFRAAYDVLAVADRDIEEAESGGYKVGGKWKGGSQ